LDDQHSNDFQQNYSISLGRLDDDPVSYHQTKKRNGEKKKKKKGKIKITGFFRMESQVKRSTRKLHQWFSGIQQREDCT